jgi:hypothetical protein
MGIHEPTVYLPNFSGLLSAAKSIRSVFNPKY